MAIEIADYLANQRGATGSVDKNAAGDALTSGQANLSSSYETFLSLLTAQLKNQDPTSPLDTNSFTQQLVQMTGVQQQLLSNQLLKSLVTQGENGDVKDALGLIGKTVSATGDKAVLQDGKAAWGYELDKTASRATLTVTDSNGKVMWSGDAPSLSQGEHSFTWDGKGAHAGKNGETYTLSVSATGAGGSTVASRTLMQGVVSSVRQSAAGTVLSIGGAEATLSSVISVREAAAKQAAAATSNSTPAPALAS
jgi:flagellar basal-body rod modification protein FlgD